MKWLRRIGTGPSREEESGKPEERDPAPVRRAAPALARVFEGLTPDEGHAVLDLGLATQDHLSLYGPYARQIRFAGLLPGPPQGSDFRAALRELASDPAHPYDVVLLWNLLDWLDRKQREGVVERLARITEPGARLYAVVDASAESTIQPVRFTPLGLDRVAMEAVGRPEPAGPPLLPAEVERLLEPFQVTGAFTLRHGQREYAAVKRGPSG